jgi:hypothetical protein
MTAPDSSGESGDYSHPDHGNIVERVLNSRVHDDERTLFCERCGNYVPADEPEQFDELDCDRYKELGDKITGNL